MHKRSQELDRLEKLTNIFTFLMGYFYKLKVKTFKKNHQIKATPVESNPRKHDA